MGSRRHRRSSDKLRQCVTRQREGRGGEVQAGETVPGGTQRPFAVLLCAALVLLALPGTVHAAETLELPTNAEQLTALLKKSALIAATFVVFALIVNRLLLAPLVRILSEREARTSGDQERAAELRSQAAQAADRLDARLRDARIEAQRTRATLLAESEAEERKVLDLSRAEAARASAEVRSSVASELEAARAGLRGQAQGLARDAAAQILGRAL